jgi:hypothetical protein
MSRRSRIVGFGSAALLVVLGVACAVVFSPGLGEDLALVLISLGAILAVSLVFFEVGLSEDRERAREAAARVREAEKQRKPPRETEPGQPAPARPPGPARRSGRPRLERMRGRPRRLR